MRTDARTEQQATQSRLARLGRGAARHHWLVIGGWFVVLAVAAMFYGRFTTHQSAVTYAVGGSSSARVEKLLRGQFPGLGTERDVIVLRSAALPASDPAVAAATSRVLAAFKSRPDVREVIPPTGPDGTGLVSKDQHTTVSYIAFGGNPDDLLTKAKQLENLAADTGDARVRGYLVGYSPISAAVLKQEGDGAERAETIGIPIALLILLLATGAVVTAVLPLVLATLGVTLAFGVLGAASYATTLDGILATVVPMIGLGVGIDYTLFIVTRFREELARRRSPGARPSREAVLDAVAVAVGRTGRTILYSGIVVMLSLLTLLVLNARTFRQLSLGTALAVACALLIGLTLLPALLGLLGHRIESGRLPWRRPVGYQAGADLAADGSDPAAGHGLFGRWARWLMRRPIRVTVVTTVVLLACASPVLHLRLGIDLGTSALSGTRAGQGQNILAREFTAGAVMPIEAIYTTPASALSADDLTRIRRFTEAASADPAVAKVTSVLDTPGPAGKPQAAGPPDTSMLVDSPLVSSDRRSTSITIVPAVAPDSTRAMDLVRRLREQGGARFALGGPTAQFVDISDETRSKLALVIGLVLLLSFLFLTVVFRSLLLPIKAILMNLLATGGAYGLIVWGFQDGNLAGVFNFHSSGTIQVYLPLVAFALLFGLSMDYEVFLVRRIQEVWRQTGDNEHAVAAGLEHTALAITAAAAIMVAVFGAFIAADILEMKQIGFALAVAILLDATLVRVVLVPAIMRLAGRANWWIPRWLDRALPDLEHE